MGHTAIQTLLGEYSEFPFGHIEPPAMLRRRMKCQLPRDPACFRRCKGLIQRGGCGGIEVIDDQSDHVCLREMPVDQLLHRHGEVVLGAACRAIDMPPTMQRLDAEEESGRAFAAIRIIVPSGLPRSGWQGVPRLTEQLLWTFIKTDLRTPYSIRLSLQLQAILPVPDQVRTHTGNTPCFTLPGLAVVFLSTRRTVASETATTSWSATRRSASHGMVQR
jgi:hypothetical protein